MASMQHLQTSNTIDQVKRWLQFDSLIASARTFKIEKKVKARNDVHFSDQHRLKIKTPIRLVFVTEPLCSAKSQSNYSMAVIRTMQAQILEKEICNDFMAPVWAQAQFKRQLQRAKTHFHFIG